MKAPQFEKTSGNKLTFNFGPAAIVKQKIDQGDAFDVAILTAPLTDALVKAGKVDAATRATIAWAGLGVAVRAGAAKPDVGTDDALKRTRLNAPVEGVQLAGPFPADLQSYLVFSAGVSSASKNADAAKALIKFLTSPAAPPVLGAKGMQPG